MFQLFIMSVYAQYAHYNVNKTSLAQDALSNPPFLAANSFLNHIFRNLIRFSLPYYHLFGILSFQD